ncbi:hypothetical protein VMCG_00636 [Cytospora schulzeri]|uniref:Vps72/YL1 C-terminal domain-containing protein n=1 Tax=Cytospora schulzeri TaxID=448051 RepID=A0A423X9H5_9PEZI|nr:hypothetical protein VMCG_00636 [Valsa malicola]
MSGPPALSIPAPSPSLAPAMPSPPVKTEPQNSTQIPLALRPDLGPRFMPPPNPHFAQPSQPSVLAAPVGMPSILNGSMPVLGYAATPKQQKDDAAGSKKASAKAAASKKAPPPPPEPPEPEPPLEGKVTRSCILLQNFDNEAIKKPETQTQILFGRKMNKLAKPPHPPLCVITNHPARHRDPKTGLPFYNVYAFKEIQKLIAGNFRWSKLTGTWVGNPGVDAAKGVPERFTRPETEEERNERRERVEREKKEADERKEQEKKLAEEEEASLAASESMGDAPPLASDPLAAPRTDISPPPVAPALGPTPPPAGVPLMMPTPDDPKPMMASPTAQEPVAPTAPVPAPITTTATDTSVTTSASGAEASQL